MKKSIILCVALATLAAFGATSLSKAKPLSADAASEGISLLGTFNNWKIDSASRMFFKTGTTYQYYLVATMSAGAEFKIYDAEHYTGSDCYIGYIDDAIITAGKFSGGGSANVKCVTAGTYKVTYTYTNATTRFISAIDEVSNYTVTEYAVKDGTVFASPMASETGNNGEPFHPTDQELSGYTFDAWYTDSACTKAYSPATLSADLNLYAKYYTTSSTAEAYFAVKGWEHCYAYSFASGRDFGELGTWPGQEVTAVTSGVNFRNDEGGVYKLTYHPGYGDTTIVFNDGGTNKTADLTLASSSGYVLASIGLSKELGAAMKLIYDINAARVGVTASTGILEASLCGIAPAKAKNLTDAYDLAVAEKSAYDGSEVASILSASHDYTYDSSDSTGAKKVNVTLSDEVNQLRLIGASGSASALALPTGENSVPLLISFLVLISGAGVVTALILLKKKRKSIR